MIALGRWYEVHAYWITVGRADPHRSGGHYQRHTRAWLAVERFLVAHAPWLGRRS